MRRCELRIEEWDEMAESRVMISVCLGECLDLCCVRGLLSKFCMHGVYCTMELRCLLA